MSPHCTILASVVVHSNTNSHSVIITEITRIAVIYRPGIRIRKAHFNTLRETFLTLFAANIYRLQIWSSVHITAAFVSACLPVCKPVWVRVFGFPKSIFGHSRSLAQRLQSRGTHSRPDQTKAPGSSCSGSNKAGSSYTLRRIEPLPENKHERWGNGDWNREIVNNV